MLTLKQNPAPGDFVLFHSGDTLEVVLTLSEERSGKAWLRTNIGHAGVRRKEIIEHIEQKHPILARDWHDIPMNRVDGCRYSLSLPLIEVGRFEAKACFLPKNESDPVWPAGGNVIVKVEPAEYCCANTMYSAFVRQFGHVRFSVRTTSTVTSGAFVATA